MNDLLAFKIYGEGTPAFLDAFISGLIPCVVTRINIPGTGQCGSASGIEARITRTCHGYTKDELITNSSTMIFPKERLVTRGCYLRINTQYAWGPPDMRVAQRPVNPFDSSSLLLWEVDPAWLENNWRSAAVMAAS